MASSSYTSSSMISKMKNWIGVRQDSDVSESSLNSTSSFERAAELLIPEDIRGRLVLYDVFISHRGSDAKKDATEIHEALNRLEVKSFLDTDGIFKGENLSAVIVKAINSSTVLLVILSKGFAESAWCLEELRLMVEKMKEDGNKVFLIPVFFGVEPEDLRDVKREPFSKAFRMHKKAKEFSSRTIDRWEETLEEVSTLLGPRLSDFNGRKENLFRAVVEDVVKRVRNVDMETAKYPVAVDEKVQELNSVINYAKSIQETPCVLGIIGMTGIGKTTVAKHYFNIFRSYFQSACFVDGIRVKAKSFGLASIQKMLLKELALLDADVRNVNEGIKLLKKRLQGVEVLLVLDDVDDVIQLDSLMVHAVLSPGSVVLVTTNDTRLLKGFENILYYEVKRLNKFQSRELFLMHSMLKQESTYPELDTYIEDYLDLCDGLPLSLEVIGRSLAGVANKFHWKNTLAKVSDILPSEIKRKFQSYFENLNQLEKEVVSDIACFFDGEIYDLAVSFWDASGTPGEKVIFELLLKNTVDKLVIHPQMKLHIIQALDEDNRKDLMHITRLWQPREVQKLLDKSPGLANLEYLSLVVRGSEKSSLPDLNGVPRSRITRREYENGAVTPWPTECFANMNKLKLLMLEDDCVVGELGKLPKSILWLRWRYYPYSILPLELPISNLRVLELDGGKLSSLWATNELTKIPLQLRHLHLQGCVNLKSLPESIGMLKHLEGIVLKGCEALTSLPNEICNAQSLNYLDLSGCSALENLPSNIGNLSNLQILDLSGCVKLLSLPNSFVELVHLISLNLNNLINVMKIPNFCKALSKLQYLVLCLDLSRCGLLGLESQASPTTMKDLDIQNDVVKLTKLLFLKISIRGCTYLPGNYGQLSLLTGLHIDGPHLVELPYSLGELSALTELFLDGCFNLKHLVHSIGKLKELKILTISSCGLVELPKEMGELCNLETLCIYHCKNLSALPSSMNSLSRLLQFELVGNSNLSISYESFSNLSLLKKLVLDGCKVSDECLLMISKFCRSLTYLKLQGLPISHIQVTEDALPNLVSLSIFSCNSLFEVEVLPKLRLLQIVRCLHLKLVAVPRGVVMWLRELTLNHCPELSVVQSIDMLQHLEKIDTVGCTNLHYIQGLELVRSLKEMHIFITYWGFHYHGDEWLQKLQTYIYAPAMHFATKTVVNKDDMFKNFQNMDKASNGSLTFQLPESTFSCAWILVAFLSHDSYEHYFETISTLREQIRDGKESEVPTYLLPRREENRNVNLTLFDGTKPMSTVHEYQAAEVGETIHFSIFTGDFWVCEELKSGRTINISSNSPWISLRSGWVRMLSMEEESNIEAIQSEFFEQLKKEKLGNLGAVAQIEQDFFSMLLDKRRSVVKSEDHFHSMENGEASLSPLEVADKNQEQVRDPFDLKIGSRSAEDMKDFQALDLANCRIVRGWFLKGLPIQVEYLAPTWQMEQSLFLQDHVVTLLPLHLEISRACRSAVDSVVAHYNTTSIQVTIKEDYDDYQGVIIHESIHFLRSEEQEAIQENSSSVLQVLMDHCSYMEYLQEIELRDEMHGQVQFFADDDNGICMFLPDLSDSNDDEYDDEYDSDYE